MEQAKISKGIGLWTSSGGQSVSHNKGLNKEQIAFLQSLKEGDRIIVWPNSYKSAPHEPDFNLRLASERKQREAEEEVI